MKRKIFINILLIFFIIVFIASAFFLIKEIFERRQVVTYVSSLQNEYVPDLPKAPAIDKTPEIDSGTDNGPIIDEEEPESTENPTIIRLNGKYPDVVGWLTVEGADVSHPFVLTDDNSSYLWTDLNGEYIRGGTLFMDYRNARDFTDNLTVIYGHNMRDGTMFGKLLNYLEFDYLTENPDVYISFPEYTAHYTIAACFVVDGADNIVFDRIGTKTDIQDVVDYIYSCTDVNPDTPLTGDSSILVLSTCNRAYDTARTLLICVPDELS